MMHDILKTQAEHILEFISILDFLIPERHIRHYKRPTRAFCEGCDLVYKVSFGLAMDRDVQQLASLVAESNEIQTKRLDEHERALSAFASFTHVMDSKIEALSQIATTLNNRSWELVKEAHKREFQLTELIVLYAEVSSFQSAIHNLLQLEGAIELLNHGFLSQNLLPYRRAIEVMEDITSNLEDTNYLRVLNPDPLSLYQETHLTAYRLSQSLHIMLKVKVSSFNAPLMLFRLDIFPLRIDGQHSTQISPQPQYIAINAEDREYLTFQNKPTIDEHATYYMQANEHQLMSKDNMSCILALFLDDLVNVKTLCQTVFQPYNAKPLAVKLNNDQFLFQNLPYVKAISTKGMESVTSLDGTTKVMQFPCNQKLVTEAGIFYTSHCHSDQATETQVVASVQNFHVLTAMIDDELLKKMEQKVSLAEVLDLNFTNPNIQIQEDPSLQAAFKTLHQVSLPLEEVINKTLENDRIYSSAAAKLSHELRNYGVNLRAGFQFPNLFSWISSPFNLPTNFLIILLAIATGYLFYRVRALGTALMLLQRPQVVAAQTVSLEDQLEQFLKNRLTTTTARPFINLPDYRPIISPDYHVVQIFIFLTLLAIFAYFLWRKIWARRHAHETQLVLELSNRKELVKIPLLTLNHSVELYTFSATEFLTHLSIQRHLTRATMFISWNSFRIRHRFLSRIYELPTTVTLDILTARRAQRILNSRYEVLIFTRAKTSDRYHLLPLEESSWLELQGQAQNAFYQPQRATRAIGPLITSTSPPSYV
jgi:hypothetical protein